MAKKLRQSETLLIMRSQIKMNPFNPKRHSDKTVKEQRRNFRNVGYLGGVVWNKATGNLIDGHRRIMAMDGFYGYDGTSQTDYRVKVEVVELSEKQEKEQMTYMALANTKANLQLIAEYLPDIDVSMAGISEQDLKDIESFLPRDEAVQIETYDDLVSDIPHDDGDDDDGDAAPNVVAWEASSETDTSDNEVSPSDRKERVKEAKRKQKEAAATRYQNLTSYITISFSSPEQKLMFCELAEVNPEDNFITGDRVMELIE